MKTIVLLRHGQSEWNEKNMFTGWVDVGLSERGKEEAREAARLMKAAGYSFDIGITSYLKRAKNTLGIVLEEMKLAIPVLTTWRLNERHYGALQGKDKAETLAKYGPEQFQIWRRSYDVPPPPIEAGSEYDSKLEDIFRDMDPKDIPTTESLKEVEARAWPYWQTEIVPRLQKGERLILAIHGNSMRALLKNIEALSGEQVATLEIPTGVPLVVHFDDDMKFLRKEYLGDPEEVAKRAEAVRDQGKK